MILREEIGNNVDNDPNMIDNTEIIVDGDDDIITTVGDIEMMESNDKESGESIEDVDSIDDEIMDVRMRRQRMDMNKFLLMDRAS